MNISSSLLLAVQQFIFIMLLISLFPSLPSLPQALPIWIFQMCFSYKFPECKLFLDTELLTFYHFIQVKCGCWTCRLIFKEQEREDVQ
jgi:hypothetical protein